MTLDFVNYFGVTENEDSNYIVLKAGNNAQKNIESPPMSSPCPNIICWYKTLHLAREVRQMAPSTNK